MRDEQAPDSVPEELEERLRGSVCGSMKPVKPLPATKVLAARFVAALGLLAAALIAFSGLGGFENMSAAQALSVSAVLGVAALFFSVSLSWQMIPGACQKAPAHLLLFVFGAGFFVAVGLMFPWERPTQLFVGGWACTYHGLVLSLPVAGLLLFLAARGAPLSYGTLGASLGATSGLLALTVLQFSCRNQHAGHLILWHGGVVLICLAVGYGFGRIAESLASRRGGRFE